MNVILCEDKYIDKCLNISRLLNNSRLETGRFVQIYPYSHLFKIHTVSDEEIFLQDYSNY